MATTTPSRRSFLASAAAVAAGAPAVACGLALTQPPSIAPEAKPEPTTATTAACADVAEEPRLSHDEFWKRHRLGHPQEFMAFIIERPDGFDPTDCEQDFDGHFSKIWLMSEEVTDACAQGIANRFNRDELEKPTGRWALVRPRALLEERFDLDERAQPPVDYQEREAEAVRLSALLGMEVSFEGATFHGEDIETEDYCVGDNIPSMGHLFGITLPEDEECRILSFHADDREGSLIAQFAAEIRQYAESLNELAAQVEAAGPSAAAGKAVSA